MRRTAAKLPLPFRLLNAAGTVPGMTRLAGLRLELFGCRRRGGR